MFRYVMTVLLLVAAAASSGAENPVRKVATIAFGPVSEMSGLARSHRFDDVYWVHNDSGDEARLFALDGDGQVIFPAYVRGDFYGEEAAPGKAEWPGHRVHVAANIDWEDIAVDDDFLYVAEMGNNGNARRDLGVYVLREPNPRAVLETRPMSFVPVSYPDQREFPAQQWHFDSESLFADNGRLYFITKHRKPGKIDEFEAGAVLYRLDSMDPGKVNVLKRIDDHPQIAVATAADLSPDGSRLAVLCYRDLWVFERPRRGDRWFSGSAYRLPLNLEETRQVEALTWRYDDTILFGNEGREWFEVDVADIPPYED